MPEYKANPYFSNEKIRRKKTKSPEENYSPTFLSLHMECLVHVFADPFPSKGLLFWLQYSGLLQADKQKTR
jgi:hypothetical protein